MVLWLVILCFAAVIAFVRLAPSSVEQWHVDPVIAVKTSRPNQFLMSDAVGADAKPEEFPMTATELASTFDDVAMSQPGVMRLAGTPGDLWVTYVQRSKLMGYPDYVSVRIAATGAQQSALNIYSRSRFGRSDLGVNRARIRSWIALLRAAVSG